MKLIDLKCSNCGAEMKVNSELERCTCNYCGKQMLIDDEIQKHEFVNGYRYGYDLEKGRLQAQEDFKDEQIRREAERKELERIEAERYAAMAAKRKKDELMKEMIKWAKVSGGILLVGIIFLFGGKSAAFGLMVIIFALGLFGYKVYKIYFPDVKVKTSNENIIPLLIFPRFMEEFSEMDYQAVYNKLMRIGFTNVRLTNLGDIKIGLLKREGSVQKIIVDGDIIESGGGKYPADVPIEIVFHGRR